LFGQWIEHGISRRPLELKLKENRAMGQPATRCFSKALQNSKRTGNNWQEIKKEQLREER
jgi:hypothetical protein